MGEGNGEAREAAVLLVRDSSYKEKDYGEVVLVVATRAWASSFSLNRNGGGR
jgi:hypothetical protein